MLRPPKVYSTAHFRLSDNVENLILQGNADLQGYGNGLSNALYGNSGNNPDRFRSSNPTTPASQSVSIASQRTVAQKPRGTAWFRGGKEDFKKAWISIEWMNGCLNNSTKDAARALPDTTFGCGNPPSTTAVLPRADLGFTCRRKSLGTDQAYRRGRRHP